MALSNYTRARLRPVFTYMLVGSTLGAAINLATVESTWGPAIQGVIDGAITAGSLALYRIYVMQGVLKAYFARRQFLVAAFINAGAYLVIFQSGRLFGTFITSLSLANVAEAWSAENLIVALPLFFLAALSIEFLLQMNELIGRNVLWYFMSGAYHQPKPEERLFMFIDLQSSTTLADQMGSAAYYGLLRRFVNELTRPVLECGGEIYQYVGDEIVLAWRHVAKADAGEAVRCFFMLQDALERNGASYERDFGVRPQFRAALHGGEVMAGELGDIKKEIVFVGDVLNTTSRLEGFGKEHDIRLAVSADVMEKITLPDDLASNHIGEFVPRGKDTPLSVYSVER